MSALIGKRIECHLETSDSDRNKTFLADVRRGRREGEIHLTPLDPGAAGIVAGYRDVNQLFIRRVLTPEEGAPETMSETPPDEAPAQEQAEPELRDDRRLSTSPISQSTRRRRGSAMPIEPKGAAGPDEYQPKTPEP